MKLADLLGGPAVLDYKGGCSSCPKKRIGFEEPVLSPDTNVIWVGESPGPIIGTGQEDMESLAKKHQIPYLARTSMVHCDSPKEPVPRAVSCCMAMLTQREVKGYPIVVLCGSLVVRTFFPKVNPKKLYGNLCAHPDYPGQRFYCMPLKTKTVERYHQLLERLGRIARDRSVAFNTYRPTDAQYSEALNSCMESKRLAIDVETNGKPQWDPEFEVTAVSIAMTTEWALACSSEDPAFTALMQKIAWWLADPHHIPVGHNLGYDLCSFEIAVPHCVVHCRVQLDTQALAYQACGHFEMGLKTFVSEELDGYRNLVPWPHREKDQVLLTDYNAEDVIYPLMLVEKIIPTMHPATLDLYIRVAGRQSFAYHRVQRQGVYFRRDVWEANMRENTEQMEANYAAWKVADPHFHGADQTSGKALEKYLFETHNLPADIVTKKGARSTDERAIKGWLKRAPFLKHLLTFRTLDKLRSTYLQPFSREAKGGSLVGYDGRVHPRYVFDTTDTGRRSCRNPNYQNPPRRPKTIRGMYGVKKGRLFLQADLSQIELRIGVSLANSLVAIEGYKAGIDLHAQMAQQMVGAGNSFDSEDRTNAKAVNFALLYGGSWEQLQEQAYNDYGLMLTDQQAQLFVKMFFHDVVPGLDQWHNASRQEFKMLQGHSRQIMGHEHYYAQWDSKAGGGHAVRSYINAKCQGPAAYIMCYILILVQQRMIEDGLDASVVGDVHDAAHIDMHLDCLPQVLDIFHWAVAETARWISPWFKVPLVMDYEIGPSWGELEEYVA